MSDYKLYDLLVAEDYKKGDEQKTSWTRVGTIFKDKATGNLSGKITEGLALSGRFVIKERQPAANTNGQGATAKPAGR